jgi:hypothetical protein
MYVTAQFVRNARGQHGVNVFAFVHGKTPLPTTARGEPDVAQVAEFEPGRCVDEHVELTPGGNVVEAYLDVVAPDRFSKARVHEAIDRLQEEIRHPQGPWTVVDRRVGVRFYATPGSDQPQTVGDALARLRERALAVIDRWESLEKNPPGPFIIWLRVLPFGLELSLPPATRARLPRALHRLGKCLLPFEALHAFPGGSRAAVIESSLAFLGLRGKQVREAGLRLVDPETGAELLSA